jgi:hypothetical protein
VDEFVCVTLIGDEGEGESAFRTRLIEFWTTMLRNHEDLYEQVYAEATEYESNLGRVTRGYMVRLSAVDALVEILTANKLDVMPIDMDDLFNRNEASGSDWFQIPHD